MTSIKVEMQEKAYAAAQAYLDKHNDGKDCYPCGFAWINVKPVNHGNSAAGKAERVRLRELGFEPSYENPKVFQLWNPSKHHCQNVDAKYAGAEVACEVLKQHGIMAYPGQRWD